MGVQAWATVGETLPNVCTAEKFLEVPEFKTKASLNKAYPNPMLLGSLFLSVDWESQTHPHLPALVGNASTKQFLSQPLILKCFWMLS